MRNLNCDVAVVGAGPAGIAAAIAAQRSGSKTVLLERWPFFGGNATISSVAAFCGFYTRGDHPDVAVAGIGADLLDYLRTQKNYVELYRSSASKNTTIKFNPEELKIALDSFLKQNGVEAYQHTVCIGCEHEEGAISKILCCDDEGVFSVKALCFIDTTGNAYIARTAGEQTIWGDSNGEVQQASMVFMLEGLPTRDLTPEELKHAVIQGKRNGIRGLGKEGGVIIKSPRKTYGFCTLPSTSLDGLDANSLTRAEMSLRMQIQAYIQAFRSYVIGCESCYLAYSGPAMGVRESHRIVGKSTVYGKSIVAGTKTHDSVARLAWSPEIHLGNASPRFAFLADNDYASLPLGTLVCPTISNLLVAGRALSSDSLALASVRVMGTAMATGQAAGVASSLMHRQKTVILSQVQHELLKQGALI